MEKRGRKPNTDKGVSLDITVSTVVHDYLRTIAGGSLDGSAWTEVAHNFIREGIERAIQEKIIPRRKTPVTYPVEALKGDDEIQS
jgi:hypothetical protein